MLVLSRHRDEGVTITIGDVRVHVILVDLRSDTARIGFEAGPEVEINRNEVQAKIDRERRQGDAGRAGP